jgi:hypothetical protein
MATQFSVIRGDIFPTQCITLTSTDGVDFSNITCTGQIRPHPDGNLIYQFVPTVVTGVPGTGIIEFYIPGSATKNFPPINLYGDIHFYSTGIYDRTLFEFRMNIVADVTHI